MGQLARTLLEDIWVGSAAPKWEPSLVLVLVLVLVPLLLPLLLQRQKQRKGVRSGGVALKLIFIFC